MSFNKQKNFGFPSTQFAQTSTTPLNDLNLGHEAIPIILVEAQKNPYAAPSDLNCSSLATQVQALDAALGSDIDISNSPSNPSAVNIVREAAANTIKGAAESFVPFRSWLRKLTGADRYSKDISLAIASGTIRRAYLKGLSQGHGCQAPAAPVN